MDHLANAHFLQKLKLDNEYLAVKPVGDGSRYAAVCRFLFTYAILVGRMGDSDSYEDRWCYHTREDVMLAYDGFEGDGEPTGWHRHPASGRRVDENGQIYVSC